MFQFDLGLLPDIFHSLSAQLCRKIFRTYDGGTVGDEHTVSQGVICMIVSVENKTDRFRSDGFYVRNDFFSCPRKIRVDHQYVIAKYNKAHIGLFVLAEVTRPVVNIWSKLMHAILRVTWLTYA